MAMRPALYALSASSDEVRIVQKLLGHRSLKTTESHYAHFSEAQQARLDEASSALNFGSATAKPVLVAPRKRQRA
jgi:integrase